MKITSFGFFENPKDTILIDDSKPFYEMILTLFSFAWYSYSLFFIGLSYFINKIQNAHNSTIILVLNVCIWNSFSYLYHIIYSNYK